MQGVDVYADSMDDELLEQFVIQYRPLVRKIALHIKRRLPSHIDLDDLLQSGLVGLLESRKTYKKDMGATFETYAGIRINGAIIDALRKNSWVTRDTIKNMRKISDAISKIEQRNQAQANTEDIVSELGITMEELFKISQDISLCNVMNLDDVEQNNASLSDNSENPLSIAIEIGVGKSLNDILERLPEKEKLILSLYYVEEFTFKQIGEILNVTEARVCQLHSQAIARIRSRVDVDSLT